MNRKLCVLIGVCAIGVLSVGAGVVMAQRGAQPHTGGVPLGSGFTYQGQLKTATGPISGTCDLQFTLWNSSSAGNQVGSLQEIDNVTLASGLFTVVLNAGSQFGDNAFNGEGRWLETAVRCPAGGGSFTTLAPRQSLTAAPYALYALNAGNVAYQGVLVVAKSGSKFSTIQSALDSATAGPDNRYLVWIAPGTYSETITMKEYVDVVGAGQGLTKITYTGSVSTTTGTVVGANNAELRDLTVENLGLSNYSIGIYNADVSPRIRSVSVSTTYGRAIGVYNTGAAVPVLDGVNVEVYYSPHSECVGISNMGASPVLKDVTTNVHCGLDSRNVGILNHASAPSMTNVLAQARGGDTTAGVYNEAGAAPTLVNSQVVGYNGDASNAAMLSQDSAPSLNNVMLTAYGGPTNYALFNVRSNPKLVGATLSASGGAYSYGVYNDSSSVTMLQSTIDAFGASTTVGVFNIAATGTYTVNINNSQINAPVNMVVNPAGFTTRIAGSYLNGGPISGDGIAVCAGVYDENYAFVAGPACP